MKEELPSILISDGWETDENDNLVEVVIPSTVDTYQAPTKVKFLGDTLNWVPSTAAALQEIEANNVTSITTKLFSGYTKLKKVVMNNLKVINEPEGTGGVFCSCYALETITLPALEYLKSCDGSYGKDAASGCFGNCSSLTSISFPSLKTIVNTQGYGRACFNGCIALANINMPALETITDNSNGRGIFYGLTNLTELSLPSLVTFNSGEHSNTFAGCSSLASISMPSLETLSKTGGSYIFNSTVLTSISLPKIKSISVNYYERAIFKNCTGLTSVTFGSPGNPVSSLSNYIFSGCTNLTSITVYTNNGASLANAPWGASNASYSFVAA